jgi:hypothetical protein
MTKARSNAVAEAAKGDLSVGTGTNLAGILPVGNSGEQIVADSSTSTGLRYTSLFGANKNKILNGDYNINQRNFTSSTDGSYGFDRWFIDANAGPNTYSSQTFTPGAAPVAGYEGKNFAQVVTTGQSGGAYCRLVQRIEDVRNFAGQTITISFWIKASSGTPTISADALQVFGSGGSSTVELRATGQVISTSWARYSFNITLGNLSGKTIGTNSYLQIGVLLSSSAVAHNNNTFQIWGVQAEAGSVATPFQTATGTLQGELAACQRYYWRNTPGTNYGTYGVGVAGSTTVAYIPIFLPVPMRITPTSIDVPTSASNLQLTNWGTTSWTPSAISIDASGSTFNTITVQATTTGLVTGQAVTIRNNNGSTSSYFIGASAEL